MAFVRKRKRSLLTAQQQVTKRLLVEVTATKKGVYSLNNVLQDSTWSEKVQGNLSQVTQTVNDRADALKVTKEELEKELEAKRAKLEEDEEAMLAQIEEKRNQLQAKVEELEAEKKAMKDVHTFQSGRLKLDVGGHKFTTSRTTLTSQPDSMLAAMFSGRHKLIQDGKGAYFIDRDGTHFRFILNYLRDGQLGSLPEDKIQLQELVRESDYYQLTELTQHIRVKLMPVVTQATIDSLKLGYHYYSYSYTGALQVDGRDASTTVTPKFTIQNSSMDKKNLANISFTGIYFSNGFSFKGSYLRGADFSGCYFGSAVFFNDADLTDVNFEGCGGLLSDKVQFIGAKLDGARFEQGVIRKLTVSKAEVADHGQFKRSLKKWEDLYMSELEELPEWEELPERQEKRNPFSFY